METIVGKKVADEEVSFLHLGLNGCTFKVNVWTTCLRTRYHLTMSKIGVNDTFDPCYGRNSRRSEIPYIPDFF